MPQRPHRVGRIPALCPFTHLVLLALAACATAPPPGVLGPETIDLGWQVVRTEHLPPSVRVHVNTRSLPTGEPISGAYALIDLSDPGVEIRATYVGDGGTRITPLEEMRAATSDVYLAVNGGFFGQSTSLNPIVSEGRILAYGQQGVTRDSTTWYPTWGAWGLAEDGVGEVVWSWGSPETGEIFAFDSPWPNRLDSDPLPPPSLSAAGLPPGRVWDVWTGMGGTPVLIDDGVVRDLGEDPDDPESIVNRDELVNHGGLTGRHPRTAVGLTADRRRLILLVIDGRQEGHSVGASLQELAWIMRGVGAHEALNIDGGGSSVMIVENGDGVLDGRDVVTRPSDAAGMRPVAMTLLVTASGVAR